MQKWLYDISERIGALQTVLDEAEDKSIEPDVKNAIEGIYESDVPAAVADGLEYIRFETGEIEKADARIKELQAWKKAREARLKRVRRGYAEFLQAIGKKKVETTMGAMSVYTPAPSTEVDNVALVPEAYMRQRIVVEPDKTSIKQAILSGHSVPGAHLESKPTIRMR